MGNHWYDQEGNPVYEVERSDGKGKRATTLRDARKLNLDPSVTTILQISAKPGLETWKQQQLLEAALLNKDLHISDTFTPTQWKGMVKQQSQKIGADAAKRGSEIHNSLEHYLLTGEVLEKDAQFLIPVIELLQEKIDINLLEPEVSFSHSDGFGGKVDASCPDYIIDFKTKIGEKVDKTCVYDEHIMQLAAYKRGLDYPAAKCYNLFISTAIPGNVYWHEWTDEEAKRGYEMFNHLHHFWKLSNNI